MTVAGLDLVDLFAESGRGIYCGERVTQLGHALQCAAHAARSRADDELVVTTLLHDIGHLVERPGATEEPGRHHGRTGAALVRPYVPARVAWLVEHHVVAKRYLVTIDARYTEVLSPTSRRSLVSQGARLGPDETLMLETHPWFADALQLRRWDDAAKEDTMTCPPLIHYRTLLERWFGPQPWRAGHGIDR